MSPIDTLARVVICTTLFVTLLLAHFVNAAIIGDCYPSLKTCGGGSSPVNGTLSYIVPTNLGDGCGSFKNISPRKLVVGYKRSCAELTAEVPPDRCIRGADVDNRPFRFACLAK